MAGYACEFCGQPSTHFIGIVEEVHMLGQPYRLIKATIAVVRNVARQVCQVLPEGAVVIVESGSDTGQRVNIRCQNQQLWMFTADLDERGNLLLDGVEMSNRTTDTAYGIAPTQEWR